MRGNSLCTVSPYSDKCRRSANHSSRPASIRYIYRRKRGAGGGVKGRKRRRCLVGRAEGNKTQAKPLPQLAAANEGVELPTARACVIFYRQHACYRRWCQVGRLAHEYPGAFFFFVWLILIVFNCYGEENVGVPGVVCTA